MDDCMYSVEDYKLILLETLAKPQRNFEVSLAAEIIAHCLGSRAIVFAKRCLIAAVCHFWAWLRQI
jgi:hypothetical protein